VHEFRGKHAVITGAGSGIGRGMAIVFARAGMDVVVSDIEMDAAERVAGEVRAHGVKAVAARTDVADLASVQELGRLAYDELGSVQVLCNNAGVSHRRRGIHATHEDWVWMLGVNLWGVVHGVETFLPAMLADPEPAHIVNTSSMNGIVPSAMSAMYSTSKYGVLGLTETIRNELEGLHVGISALCPAAVRTRIFESERNRPAELQAPTTPPPHVASSRFDLSPALEPEVVGEMVLQGIRRNQLYIFTDMKIRPLIEHHHALMMQAFDDLADFERGKAAAG